MMWMRKWLLSTTCLVAVAAAGGVQAAGLPDGYGGLPTYDKLPAVSGLNGKVGAFGAGQDGSLAGITGAVSVPLGFPFGLQIDGMAGSGKSKPFYGVGAHLFWRDPAKGLLGLYSSYVSWDTSTTASSSTLTGAVFEISGANVGKIGAEGAAYLGRISLEGRGGYQFGTKKGLFGKALLAFYPTDDLRLDGGVRYLNGVGAIGMLDAEWQPHIGTGLTLFASGSFGANDYKQALGGVRFYFADTGKTLIQRHRRDDPENDLPGDLITTTGATHCPSGQQVVTSDGSTYCGVPSQEN